MDTTAQALEAEIDALNAMLRASLMAPKGLTKRIVAIRAALDLKQAELAQEQTTDE